MIPMRNELRKEMEKEVLPCDVMGVRRINL